MISDMPATICLNRVSADSECIQGFDNNDCHIGTGYVKANRAMFDIADERQRQIEKGYDASHDDADARGSHAQAAAYYATAAHYQRKWDCDDSDNVDEFHRIEMERQDVQHQADDDSVGYPWPSETKSVEYSPRANLVKAAALLIAEIERIDREEAAK